MTNPFSKIGHRIKKGVKKTGKGVKKVGNKTKKNLNKGLKSYDKVNKKIKKNLKGTGLGTVYDVTNTMINPVEQANMIRKNKKNIVKGAKEFSKAYEEVDGAIYKNLKSIPVVGTAVAETYNLGNSYINPLGTIKNASDVISGRQSIVEGLANEYTPYGDYNVAKGIYDRNK